MFFSSCPPFPECLTLPQTAVAQTTNIHRTHFSQCCSLLAWAASLLTGFEMAVVAPGSSLHTVTFATLLSVMLYVITDLEFPRLGLIKSDSFDHVLEDALRDMG